MPNSSPPGSGKLSLGPWLGPRQGAKNSPPPHPGLQLGLVLQESGWWPTTSWGSRRRGVVRLGGPRCGASWWGTARTSAAARGSFAEESQKLELGQAPAANGRYIRRLWLIWGCSAPCRRSLSGRPREQLRAGTRRCRGSRKCRSQMSLCTWEESLVEMMSGPVSLDQLVRWFLADAGWWWCEEGEPWGLICIPTSSYIFLHLASSWRLAYFPPRGMPALFLYATNLRLQDQWGWVPFEDFVPCFAVQGSFTRIKLANRFWRLNKMAIRAFCMESIVN